jgi:hypothetical protein
MARKKPRRSKDKGKRRGPRGPRGVPGPPGPAGPNGQFVVELGAVLSRVTQELEDVQRTLRVQFTRIAQLQAELDDVRTSLTKVN